MTVGQRISECRKKNGISQEALAEATRVSRQTVSKWENDQAAPDTYNMLQLAKILGVSIEYLVSGGEMNNESVASTDKLPEDHAISEEDLAEEREEDEKRKFQGFWILCVGIIFLIRTIFQNPNVTGILFWLVPCIFGAIRMFKRGADFENIRREAHKIDNEAEGNAKMNIRRARIFSIICILTMLAASLITFWCVMSPTDALGFVLIFFYVIYPVVSLVVSSVNSYNGETGGRLMIWPVIFAVLLPLLQYFTFVLANAITSDKDLFQAFLGMFDEDLLGLLLVGAIPSAIGIGLGRDIRKNKEKRSG